MLCLDLSRYEAKYERGGAAVVFADIDDKLVTIVYLYNSIARL